MLRSVLISNEYLPMFLKPIQLNQFVKLMTHTKEDRNLPEKSSSNGRSIQNKRITFAYTRQHYITNEHLKLISSTVISAV